MSTNATRNLLQRLIAFRRSHRSLSLHSHLPSKADDGIVVFDFGEILSALRSVLKRFGKIVAYLPDHTALAKHIVHPIIARCFIGKIELRPRIEQQLDHSSVIDI